MLSVLKTIVHVICLAFDISDPCYSIFFASKSLTEPKLWKTCKNNFRYFPINEKTKNKLFSYGQEIRGSGFTDILEEDIKGLIEPRET